MTQQTQSFRELLANDGYAATFQTMGQYRTALLVALRTTSFQARVEPWMLECFGAEIAADQQERNHRFLEEALELVQSCGATASEAHQLVDYVYGRPVGDRHQEAGGVMVTLAALCLAQGLDMHAAGETELARIWTKVEQIRAKQAAKPKHSPLPKHVASASSAALTDERQTAEGEYACSAFNYERDPIGSRDWRFYWKGWRTRAALAAAPADQVEDARGSRYEELFAKYHEACADAARNERDAARYRIARRHVSVQQFCSSSGVPMPDLFGRGNDVDVVIDELCDATISLDATLNASKEGA